MNFSNNLQEALRDCQWNDFLEFIDSLPVNDDVKAELRQLSPLSYTGYSKKKPCFQGFIILFDFKISIIDCNIKFIFPHFHHQREGRLSR